MHFSGILFLALTGLGSLTTAAPYPVSHVRGGVDRRSSGRVIQSSRNGANETAVIIEQTIIENSVTIIQENLGLLSELALLAEQEFSALVQAQLALVQEIETIKNNIRINHFLARFSQVNTIIVIVTQVVDVRSAASPNNRYMVNQQLADRGAQSSVIVMVTAASPMTIGLPTSTLDVSSLVTASGLASLAALVNGTATDSNTGNSTASASADITSFDPNSPFGQFNQSIVLPYGSSAPSLSQSVQILTDPAAIILPNQANLLVEDINQFSQDCAVLESTSTLFTLQALMLQADQIAAQLLGGIMLGATSSLNAAAAALLGSGNAASASSATSSTSSSATASITPSNTATEFAALISTTAVASASGFITLVPAPSA